MKVLLADDDALSLRATEKHIREWGYEVLTAQDGEKAWDIIEKGDIRLVVLDWMMPKLDGVEICEKIRTYIQKKKTEYIYVILLTGRTDQGDIIQGLTAGADDYITKPFHFLELQVRLKNGERIIELENHRINLASIDSLTRLWSRKKILEFLDEELDRSKRLEYPLGVIMSDIDHFKNVNDEHGHLTGDLVLTNIAERMKNSIRRYDKIGRYGGDEFLIILPNCNGPVLLEIAERLRKSISKTPLNAHHADLGLSISMGGTTSENSHSKNSTELIRVSDKALYSAKRKGRNRFVLLGSEGN